MNILCRKVFNGVNLCDMFTGKKYVIDIEYLQVNILITFLGVKLIIFFISPDSIKSTFSPLVYTVQDSA